MATLLALSRLIDAINFRIGKVVSWLILIVVIISATNATVRKVFDTSSNAWLELQWVLFGVDISSLFALDAALERAHPHRHRERNAAQALARHRSTSSGMRSFCCR